MGTLFRITVFSDNDPAVVFRAAFDRIGALDAALSDYQPDSELNRLCRARRATVSDDLLTVLTAAQRLARETDGAFDVTQGPVIRLWREARRTRRLPSPAALIEAADRTGWQHLEIDGRSVRLLLPNMQLDLGGIAKGYAADEALRLLKDRGLPGALVAASGDLAIGDPPPRGPGWRVGVDSFRATPTDFTRVLTLHNRAVSTSGDTEQYVEIQDHRYSHILDPHTHRPLTERLGVTVVAGQGIVADSLATALSVLGPDRGLAFLARRRDAAALFVTKAGERFSEGFPNT